MVEEDARGVLLYENILKAADTELSGKRQCSPVGAGHCFPQQSILAALRFLGENGYYSGTTRFLQSLHFMSSGDYFEGVFQHSQCCAKSLLVFQFIVILQFRPDPELCCWAAKKRSTQ